MLHPIAAASVLSPLLPLDEQQEHQAKQHPFLTMSTISPSPTAMDEEDEEITITDQVGCPSSTILPKHLRSCFISHSSYQRQDVLFGRGGGTNHHAGNLRYRELINAHRQDYVQVAIKSEKANVSRRVVKAIKAGNGRFLRKGEDGRWHEVSDKEAVDKASQALREKTNTAKAAKVDEEKMVAAPVADVEMKEAGTTKGDEAEAPKEDDASPARSSKAALKRKRDPNKPKGCVSATLMYSNAHRKARKVENPDATFGDIARMLVSEYKALPSEEKAVWEKVSCIYI